MEFPREEIYPQLEKKEQGWGGGRAGGRIKACIFSNFLKNTFESIKFHFTYPE